MNDSLYRRLPYQHACSLCRASFRTKRGRQALCETCAITIRTIAHAVEAELTPLIHEQTAASGQRERAIQKVRDRILGCSECGWTGNFRDYRRRLDKKPYQIPKESAGRQEAVTIAEWIASAAAYAYRLLVHKRDRHWKKKQRYHKQHKDPIGWHGNYLREVVACALCSECRRPIGRRGSFQLEGATLTHSRC